MTVTSRRPSQLFGRGAALLVAAILSAAVPLGSTTGLAAAAMPTSGGLDAPIHAFDWPGGAPDDPYYANQLDLGAIGMPDAWLRTTGVPSVVVAVLDTGIDASHPEFAGRLVAGFDALTGMADTTANFGPTDDDEGHGTHVAGTVAASANNGQGIAGIAPNVSIMPVKILDSTGTGDFRDLVAGMNWAVAHGARIITMSLGGTLDPAGVAFVQPTFDAAYAAGAVVVAASGNDGTTLDQYPCNFVHVICVGSATRDGSAVSTFSTRTAGVALIAPGESVVSTLPGGNYGYGTGTSMATPHVTGAVALLRSIDPTIGADQVFADLTQTARPLVTGGRNPDSGYGLLQVGAAVDLAAGGAGIPGPTPTPAATPSPSPTPDPATGPTPAATPTPTSEATPTPTPSPTPVAPSVRSVAPHNGARNVLRGTRPELAFSVPIAGISTRTVTMVDLSRGRRVLIRISYDASTGRAAIKPVVRLAANHSYRILIAGITATNGGPALRQTIVVTFRTGYR